jgi:uncharacterized membrane protein
MRLRTLLAGLGTVSVVVGFALVARAAIKRLPKPLATRGTRPAVDLHNSITIDAPPSTVYAFWSSYDSFPRFMSRVLDVHSSEHDPRRSHWKVAGPAGRTIEFDAETRVAIPNELIAWRTLPESPVTHSAVVMFQPQPEGRTRVQLRMTYNPPLGADTKSSIDADLARMKTLIETGTTAQGV